MISGRLVVEIGERPAGRRAGLTGQLQHSKDRFSPVKSFHDNEWDLGALCDWFSRSSRTYACNLPIVRSSFLQLQPPVTR